MEIYFQPLLINGSVHLFNYLKRSKQCLNAVHFDVVKRYFLINGGYFHPENLMVAGLLSPHSTPEIRERAKTYQLNSRLIHENRDDVRPFFPPLADYINWDLENISFFDILKWTELPPEFVTPSPVMNIYTVDEVKDYYNLIFPDFKCHSQRCEADMKDIAETVFKNVGQEKQKTSLVCNIESRDTYNCTKFRKEDFT